MLGLLYEEKRAAIMDIDTYHSLYQLLDYWKKRTKAGTTMQAKNYFDNKEKWYWRREKTPQAYGQLEWGNAITALKRSKWAMKLLRFYNEIVVIMFCV